MQAGKLFVGMENIAGLFVVCFSHEIYVKIMYNRHFVSVSTAIFMSCHLNLFKPELLQEFSQ